MLLLVPQTTPASARANSKDADDASVLKGVAVAHILNLDVNETTMEGHLLILLIPNPAVELTSIVVSVSSVLLGKAEPNLS